MKQILSKMDGLVNLQNVLVVGMTNRKELLDEALIRPGRMEVRCSLLSPLGKNLQPVQSAIQSGLLFAALPGVCVQSASPGRVFDDIF